MKNSHMKPHIFLTCLALGISTQSAISGQDLEKIKARGEIKICSALLNYPQAFYTPTNEPEGMQVELMDDLIGVISEEVGVKLGKEVMHTNAANRLAFLTNGQCDIIFTNMTADDEKRKILNVIEPYWFAGFPDLLTQNDVTIKAWEDVKGKTVCGYKGNNNNRIVAEKYGADVIAFGSHQEGVHAMKEGRCIGYLNHNHFFQGQLLAAKDQPSEDNSLWAGLKVQNLPPYTVDYSALGIRYGDDELAKLVSDTVVRWHRDGVILAAAKKWGLELPKWNTEMQEKYASN